MGDDQSQVSMMSDPLRSRRRLKVAFAIFLFFLLCLVVIPFRSSITHVSTLQLTPPESASASKDAPLAAVDPPTASEKSTASSISQHISAEVCTGYPSDADVVIVVKTGATEASRRLPLQLLSFLSCAKNDVLVFSDLEQEIGDLHVYDSLEDVTEEATLNNTDFKLYRDQKQHVLEGQDLGRLDGRSRESWALDKYKNIHTAQKSWQLRPNKSFYFFIDADTYVVWSSFFAWLKTLDANQKLYLGVEVPSEYYPFAHGGSGYLLSRAAMEVLNGEDSKRIAYDFDMDVKNICCGDIELGKSLYEKEVTVVNAHPMVNGDKANNYRFGSRIWCKPLITMHHIAAEEMNDLWQFERSRKHPEKPLLFAELWTDYLEPKLPKRRSDWSNLAPNIQRVTIPATHEDWENFAEDWTYEPPEPDAKEGKLDWAKHKDPHRDSYESVEKCARACREKSECFQYMHSDQKCQLSKYFRFGQKKAPDGEKRWMSGWDLDKIEKFTSAHAVCTNTDWKAYMA